jgi:hypothetical protein
MNHFGTVTQTLMTMMMVVVVMIETMILMMHERLCTSTAFSIKSIKERE